MRDGGGEGFMRVLATAAFTAIEARVVRDGDLPLTHGAEIEEAGGHFGLAVVVRM